uniref:DNA helicase MCM8 n=1 Tax=Phallusia mammillata TaxID=59560 RepID=A0A6F9DJS1_9ASCI|nr:DNA helicase MCM8 [Phallusia mammillata]
MADKRPKPSKQQKEPKKKNNWYRKRLFAENGPQIISPPQTQINVGPQTNAVFCPYKAWRHYFPTEEYNATSETVKKSKELETYFKDFFAKNDMNAIVSRGSIPIDCKDLVAHKNIKEKLPNLYQDLQEKPEHTLGCLGLSAHHYITRESKSIAGTSSQTSNSADIPVIRARIFNFEPLTALKHLKARSIGNFVSVRGTLVKVGNVRPMCTTMAFKCGTCGQLQALLLVDNKYALPNSCIAEKCRGRNFEPLRNHPLTEITDYQVVKLQEALSDEQREAGRMPRTVEVELMRDLADTASPGDIVTITGVAKVKKSNDGGIKVKDKSMFLLYIEGNHVSNARSNSMQDCRIANEQLLDFSERDLAGIKEIARQEDIFALLACSVCPTIYGQDMVKAGLLLALFGGNMQREKNSDILRIRGNSHVLLVGDPGLGKSQLLQAVSRLAPRGVYVCGNTSSSSGLTVTLSRDPSTGDTALEAGALVLADQGVCCIDEFDKMSQQHQALLEAMEQQSISIAKAGIVCSMPARCSIVAAANPVGGHYNKGKTVSENLKLGSALLSRFDLVYILLDTPNVERDRLLSDHVMAVHTGKKLFGLNKSIAAASESELSCSDKEGLMNRLRSYASSKDCDPVPHSLLWKFIAYARKNVKQVKLSVDACKVLKDFYLELRQKGHQSDSTPITTRQLESLRRLTEARARLELRTEATDVDAMEVVEIMRHCLYETFADEVDTLVFERSFHGSGVSGRSKVKKLIAALNKAAQVNSRSNFKFSEIRTVASQIGLDAQSVGDLVETLNNQGFLLKTGASMYKLQTIN